MCRARDCLDWLLASIENDSLNLKTDVVMKFGRLASKVCDQSDDITCLDNISSEEIHKLITGKTARRKRGLFAE